MATINPYLNFDGKTEEAFNFYKSLFGGEFLVFQRFSEVPGAGDMPQEEGKRIMHLSLPMGKHVVLMGSDTQCGGSQQEVLIGNNFFLSLNTDSEEETERLFKGLAEKGLVIMPLEKAFWGAYFGMIEDQFGIKWMLNYEIDKVVE